MTPQQEKFAQNDMGYLELTVNKVESMSKHDIIARMEELSLNTAGILPSADVIDVESELLEDETESTLGTQQSQNQSG